MNRKIKIIKRTQVEELERHRNNKFKCQRCLDVFPDKQLLTNHRQDIHGEFETNDKLKNTKGKESHRIPPKTEWIIPLTDAKFWWYNPWHNEYMMYVLGIGCISNKLYLDKNDKNRMKEMVVCDESTQYFRTWRDILFENKPILGEPTPRPTLKPLKWNSPESIEGLVFPRSYTYCRNCYHILRIIKGNHYRCKKCNHLVTVNEKDNSERYWDSEKQKEYTHRCKTSLEESTDDVLLLCPCCGRNIFRKSKDTNIPQSTGIIQTVKLYVKEQKRRF